MTRADGRTERGAQTRARILEAAIDLIAAGGQAAATQRAVADRAGVSLANVTYHFATAKSLLVAAMRRAAGIATTRVAEEAQRVFDGEISFEDSTVNYIELHRSGEFAAGIVAMELSTAAVRDPELRSSGEDNIDSLRSIYEPYVEKPGQADAIAAALTGLLLLELGSNRPANSEQTRLRVRTIVEAFGLDIGMNRARRSPSEPTTPPTPKEDV